MNGLLRYWNLWRIDPAGKSTGVEEYAIVSSQEFLSAGDVTSSQALDYLLSLFESTAEADWVRSQAGLCLRCYVSWPILSACRKLSRLFGQERFTYRELLPYVLNDDGQTLIVLSPDRKKQLELISTGQARALSCPVFSVRILQTFKAHDSSSMSLDNWAYLKTKQNPELKRFLSEFGFKSLSDWALINRVGTHQLERLSTRDRQFVEVFHLVYRRDRRQQHQHQRCPNPTAAQLQEMTHYLRDRGIEIQPDKLFAELKQVAKQLRQYDVWRTRASLEFVDKETGDRLVRTDLPPNNTSEQTLEAQEEQELLDYFHAQLKCALSESIRQAIRDRVITLEKSKGYANFAHQFLPGLRLYYQKNLSLKEIGLTLGFSNWAQTRRILNPGALISTVRTMTIQQVLEQMLKKAQEKGLTSLPPTPDYLKALAEQVEALADAEIFRAASEEIRSGRHRSLDSVYAQQVCFYLNEFAPQVVHPPLISSECAQSEALESLTQVNPRRA